MALIVVVLGSVLGFFGAIAGWLFWDVSTLGALSIWLLSGPTAALVMLLAAALTEPSDEGMEAEVA